MTRNHCLRGRADRQRGFGSIMAIMVLVIMAALAAALVSISTTQQLTSAQDMQSARALAAARTGTDIGLFKALSTTTPLDSWKTCASLSQAVDLTAATGFRVNISCNSWIYNEGETAPGTANPVRIYQITATACNSPTSCPDASMVNLPGYVERVRQVTATN